MDSSLAAAMMLFFLLLTNEARGEHQYLSDVKMLQNVVRLSGWEQAAAS